MTLCFPPAGTAQQLTSAQVAAQLAAQRLMAQRLIAQQAALDRLKLQLPDAGFTLQGLMQGPVPEPAARSEPAPPMASGAIGLDNHGNPITGWYRATAKLQLAGALDLGEQFQLQGVLGNESLRDYQLGYQMPLGPWGTRVGARLERLRYTLGDPFAALDARGRAKVATAFASQPLLQSGPLKLDARLQYESTRMEDEIGRYRSLEHKRTRVTTLGLHGHWRDGLGGAASSAFGVDWSHGRLQLDAAGAQRDARSAQREGSFQRLTAQLARWQPLGGPWSLQAQLRAQWANKNLDSSQKMSLGGAHGVRAFLQGEAAGDEGLLGQLELRYQLAHGWHLSGFVDAGKVRVQHTPWNADDNRRSLSGAGLGVQRIGRDWSLGSALAWRLSGKSVMEEHMRSPVLWVYAQKQF